MNPSVKENWLLRLSEADSLMRTAGLSPVDRVEHISYFLFLKWLDDQEKLKKAYSPQKSEALPRLKNWGFENWVTRETNLVAFIEKELFEYLRSMPDGPTDNENIRELFRYAHLLIRQDDILIKVLEIFRSFDLADLPITKTGEIFEAILEHWANSVPELFFTKRDIVRLMVSLVSPKPGDSIYDPACGTGGFLVGAADCLASSINFPNKRQQHSMLINGYEISPRLHHLALINLILHDCSTKHLICGDALTLSSPQESKYDVILCSPPTGLQRYAPTQDLVSGKILSKESLFLDHIMRSLRKDGRAAVLLPDSILWRDDDINIREALLTHFYVDAIISLPSGYVSASFSGNSNILLFRNTGKSSNQVWFAEFTEESLTNENYALNMIAQRAETTTSRFVNHGAIVKHRNILIPSRYRPTTQYGGQYKWVALGEVLSIRKERLALAPDGIYQRITVRQRGEGVTVRDQVQGHQIASKERQQIVRARQVVVSKIEAKSGAIGIVPKECDGAIVSHNYYVYDVSNRALPEYLEILFQYEFLAESIKPFVRGATGHAGILSQDFLSQRIPLPPLEVQEKMAKAVNEHQTQLREIEQRLAKTLSTLRTELLGG